jgi:hypothetical protein
LTGVGAGDGDSGTGAGAGADGTCVSLRWGLLVELMGRLMLVGAKWAVEFVRRVGLERLVGRVGLVWLMVLDGLLG